MAAAGRRHAENPSGTGTSALRPEGDEPRRGGTRAREARHGLVPRVEVRKGPRAYDIVVFGDQAEAVVEHIGKGDRIMVAGRLQVEDYEKKDGSKGKRVEIIADAVGRVVRDSKNPVDQLKQVFNATEIQDEDPF